MNIEDANLYASLFEDEKQEKFIKLKIFGKIYEVPAHLSLLKNFQYIAEKYQDYKIDLTKHCWSGICKNCLCKFQDEQLGKAKGLACLMETDELLELLQIPKTMKKISPKNE